MPHNLATLVHLMDCNDRDFRSLRPRARQAGPPAASLADLKSRRRKAVNLVEELSIRTQKVQPLMKRLEQVSARMGELVVQLQDHRAGRGGKEDRANLAEGAQGPDADHARDPASLRQPGRG